MINYEAYAKRRDALSARMKGVKEGESVRLQKDTSNLFRNYKVQAKRSLNVRDFNHVLEVNAEEGWIEVEGMTTYNAIVTEALRCGVMPTVVPQLKSITIGGAISGVGIEATSFRYGLVHETVLEMDILLASGEVVTATPDNAYKDLFFGIPNSYGSLGYVLKVKVQAIPVKKYVHVEHIRFNNYQEIVEGIKKFEKDSNIDFLDGVIFSPNEMYLSLGKFVDAAPYASDYTYKNIYYKSIQKNIDDYVTTHDYIWRWDTDWFWCSNALYMQNPLMRLIMGRKRLNSVTYTKMMRWDAKWGITKRIASFLKKQTESVIQDVAIPLQNLEAFLKFYQKEIDITPIWLCPSRAYNSNHRFSLFPLEKNTTYVDVGFWGSKQVALGTSDGKINKVLEQEVQALQGIKSLYSSVYYDEATFWNIFNGEQYKKLKQQYDPASKRPNLYQVVTKHNS